MAFRIASLLCLWWGCGSNCNSRLASVGAAQVPRPPRSYDSAFKVTLYEDYVIINSNSTNTTDAPTDSNSTKAPTASPDNSTVTTAPTPGNSTNHTAAPTLAPTLAPTTSNSNHTANHTKAPATTAPAPAPVHPPTNEQAPTSLPSQPQNNNGNNKEHVSFLRIIGKTIAWMILLLLGTVAFGGFMQHRYRIYYFARGCYYTVLRLNCTQWILRKLLRFDRGGRSFDNSLNTIIFDNEMTQGLLMQENND